MRDLVANGAALAKLRDTPIGLRWFLQIATRATGVVIEEPSEGPFRFVVGVPRDARAYLGVINRIVEMDMPAASTFEIVSEPAPEEDQP